MITYSSVTLTSYNSITKIEIYYYKSTSATALSGGSWSITKPTWENGKYIWQKTRTYYEGKLEGGTAVGDGSYYTESNPVNITGQQGATGTAAYSYKLNASNTSVIKSQKGVYSVSSITFTSTVKQGTGNVIAYAGRFIIQKLMNGTWTNVYTSSSNESSKTYTIPNDENLLLIKCSLYQAGGTTVLLDQITVPIVKDGIDAIGLKDSFPIYLASDKDTGITIHDTGWTRYKPKLTTENKYLWVCYISRYSDGITDPILIEKSGGNINFTYNGEESPLESVKVNIEPVQSGSGDPSPSNVCPITGHTGLNVSATGKNLFNKDACTVVPNYYITATGELNNNAAYSYVKTYQPVKPNTDYVFSGTLVPDGTGTYNSVAFYDINKIFISRYTPSNGSVNASFTTPSSAAYIRWNMSKNNHNLSDIQLEEGSTATSYESFGDLHSIDWQSTAGTVYGGTLDVVSGVLTVDRAIYTLTGEETWERWGSAYKARVLSVSGSSNASTINCVSDMTVSEAVNTLYYSGDGVGVHGAYLYVGSTQYENIESYVGMNVVYKRGTSLTYQLAPQEIIVLNGINNIFSDQDSIDVTYYDNQKTTVPMVDYSVTSTFETAAQVLEDLENLETNLQNQIDEKIQTYYQSTNPASSWKTNDERLQHDGDLWYYTGTTTATYTKDNVYRYNSSNNTWTVYTASGELFNQIDRKSTIYYGKPTSSFSNVKTGDYLVDSTDGCSYKYNGSQWVKITDYKTGIDAAQSTADEAKSRAIVANTTAENALTTANGKNTIYYQNAQPSGGTYVDGDSWYDTDGGNALYIYNGSTKKWVKEEFGAGAIKDLTITNAKIANSTIQSAKIVSLEGAKIVANSITSNQLATDAIKSNNYVASPNTSSPYSAIGTFLNLADGNIYTPNFGVDSVNSGAYINGQIVATSGQIGDSEDNYWQIGTLNDYNMNPSAAIVGHGTSYIQSGTWQISNDRINTQTYDSNRDITYMHYNSKYWDYGMQVPELDTSADGYISGVSNNWLYIRRSKSNSIPALETDWDYLFKVDKDGTIYENGTKLSEKYASITDVDSVYLPKTGGTVSGNLTVTGSISGTASKANALTHTLSINGKSWTGSANLTVGTIGVAYGGTGKTTGKDAANYFLNSLDTGSSTPVDKDYYISQYVNGGTSTTTYHRRPMSALWLYIKSKIADDGVYMPKSGGTFTGAVNVADSFYADSATLGDLVVNGGASLTNNLQANTINGVTVGSNPKFTDTVTTITTSGSGNAITSITASNGTLTAKKEATFLTSHQTVTNKAATLAWNSAVTIATIGSTNITAKLPVNPNTNTTYTIATGDSNGQIKVTPSSGSAYNVSVKGLGSNAYSSTSYLPLAGGTVTGNIKRYNSGASTEPMITLLANNQDAYLFEVGHGSAAASISSSNHYKLLYKGTNTSPDNYLQLIASTGSADTIAMQVNENGNVSFTNTVDADISGNAATATNATNATNDSDGNAINTTYLKLSGGTLDGDLAFKTIGTWPAASGETYPITSSGISWSGSSDNAAIFYRIDASDTGNLILRMGDDSNATVIFSSSVSSKGDGIVINPYNRTIEPISNNVGSLGTSSKKWANIYATTFTGALSGNATSATSATKATNDSDGNAINTTYIKKSTFTAAHQLLYSTAASTPAILSPNTTTTKKFLRMTGTGNAGAAPTWDTVTKTDVGLSNVLNVKQVTGIGQGENGKIRVFKGTGDNDYEDIAVEIVATETSSVLSTQKLSSYGGSATQPVYFPNQGANAGKPVAISYTIEKSVPSNAVFTDTWKKVSTSQDGYISKLSGSTTTFLRGDGTWGTPTGTYSLPLAASGTRGGIQIGYSSSGKNYAVQLSSEKAYVNVPWTDTTYSAGTGISLSGTTFSNSGVTGIKGDNESNYRTGQVNITKSNIGLGSVENKSSATIRGEITSSNVTTALGYTPTHTISLGRHQDYERCVIALCETSAANTVLNSWSNGVLTRQRDNGLIATKIAYVTFSASYKIAYSACYSLLCNHDNTSTEARSGEGFRACTFTYNNKTYAGLEFYQTHASYFNYNRLAGTFTPFMVCYYNVSSKNVINTEINDSLSYDSSVLFRQSFNAQKVNNHTVNSNVPSNAIFTDTWNALSTSQAGYVAKAPNDTAKFLRGDATWASVTKANVGLGNVENTALSTWAGTNKITTVGTVSSGTWKGSTIAVSYGGTGATTFTSNAVLYGNGTGAIQTKASANGALYATSANGSLSWGTLPIAQGGTGATTANNAINNMLNGLPVWSAVGTDSTYFIRENTAGNGTYGKVPFSTLWSYITEKGDSTYVTLATTQTVSGRKTFNDLADVTFKPSSGSNSCTVNYNSDLDALVFSFA